jgi:serine/threonine-protein kinase
LKVAKGSVTVSPGTPGARVFLVSGTDRRELPELPTTLDVDASKSWSLEATKDGYQDYRQPIDFDDGKADKAYAVTLEPDPSAARVSAVPAREPRATPPRVPVSPVAKATPARAGAGAARDGGYLNINSLPASTCSVDGKSLGFTPRLHVSVTAGAHTVKFRNPESGATKTVVVNVGAGETRLAATRIN